MVTIIAANLLFLASLLLLTSILPGLLRSCTITRSDPISLLKKAAGHLSIRRRTRQRRFLKQLLPALCQISNMLRAGCSIEESFKTVATENEDPLALEFTLLLSRLKINNDLESALKSLAARMPIYETIIFVNSIVISKKCGANMVEQLRNIEDTLRKRFYIEEKVRSMTVQSKLQALISALMPVCLIFCIRLIDPGYFDPLMETGTGSALLISCIAMELAGILMMIRLSRVRF